MTLFKQLLIGFFLLFFILMSSIFITQYKSANDFLESQQTISMHNLSSAVQIAIEPYVATNDIEKMVEITDTLYSQGFHGYIKLQYQDQDEPIVVHQNDPVNRVPSWFKNMVNIEPVVVTQAIPHYDNNPLMITVANNLNNTYLKLWRATYHLLINFFCFLLVSLILLVIMIRHILTPIKRLQLQADKIAQQNFGHSLPIPNISELKALTHSFNHMSAQIEANTRQQAEETEKLRQRIYQDPITGLANLDYLMASTGQSLASSKYSTSLLLLHSDLIQDHLENDEFIEAQRLAQQMAIQLKTLTNDNSIIANISLFEFVLILPTQSHEDMENIALTMLNKAEEIQAEPFNLATLQARVGVVTVSEDDDLQQSLKKARIAVQDNLIHTGDNITFYTNGKHADIQFRSAGEWRLLVKKAVANMEVKLTTQSPINQQRQPIHQEVFAHIEYHGDQFNAGQFINAIQYHSEGLMFDMHILELLFRKLTHSDSTLPVAVNITVNSINSANFSRWLDNKLNSHPHFAEQLIFELPEIAFIRYESNIQRLVGVIQKHGFRFGIDHFGHNFNQIHYLNKFKPSYVKLDHVYTVHIDEQQKADLLSSILRYVTNLNILIIATRIENSAQMETLYQFELQNFQGFLADAVTNESKE
ncbi:bifunctional diguanylate cyclase/phosphodiesterase [Vibrio rumoiensis]|uniref:Diguanylate phosphodiesterase n=1 Tax=Vibrio rumoiensis 1S-45 TaxID=1188252 RepID=A0A1E5DZF4_9VIBR|nr:EAL domain-containing protein [Vibrio rumoiensis]OEF23304.1 hypothetical protein A1QC_12455 [Vibrio rumoiensis 1S-45]